MINQHCYKLLEDQLEDEYLENVLAHLDSESIKNTFNTDSVYDMMEANYITTPNEDEYQKQINFMLDPARFFEEEA